MAGGLCPNWHVPFLSSLFRQEGMAEIVSWQVLARLVTEFAVYPVSIYVPSLILFLPLLYFFSSVTHFLQTRLRCVAFFWERGGDSFPRASLPRVPGLRPPSLIKNREMSDRIGMCGQILTAIPNSFFPTRAAGKVKTALQLSEPYMKVEKMLSTNEHILETCFQNEPFSNQIL